MRRLHSHEWEHLIQTKDDEIKRLTREVNGLLVENSNLRGVRDQLKQELSLAEEGLANYAQENERLRKALFMAHAELCEGSAGGCGCDDCRAYMSDDSPAPQDGKHSPAGAAGTPATQK